MKQLCFAFALIFAPLSVAAQEEAFTTFNASEITEEQFLWIARPIVVFADTEADPRFAQQLALLEAQYDELLERDVIIITDTDPSEPSALREQLRPRGFAMILMAKDGTVILRKPFPWNVREISRTIDKQPLRQFEIEDRRGNAD
ncbi:DUF4174 domain-containing protein [Cochlodiniinecator piscidefendens]|uniref:DUF4174 domain-containing protein n=1 Tax=Cochlodiniinecator piscidefendens TaxID=2715756 RepID=UPI00140C8E11|nr:DUF4174 domain-containing protein [Cochlodiniinecator piscidefendens]